MHRYTFSLSYIQCKENDQIKMFTMYIDRRPNTIGNILGFINSSQPMSTNKLVNCIFKAHEGNHVFVCGIKSISAGEDLLIDYNLNCIDTKKISIMGLVCITFKTIALN